MFERMSAGVKALWARRPGVRAQQMAEALHEAQAALKDQALRDPVTGLANRLLFEDRLDSVIRRADSAQRRFSILFIDLDGFKPINEFYGHRVGDLILQEMGARLAALARQSDTVARLTGDQFLMLIDGNPDASAAAVAATRVREAMAQPITVCGRDLKMSCSIGIVLYPEHGIRAKLLVHAEAAMRAAKQAGAGLHAFFEDRMESSSEAQIDLQRELREALDHGARGLSLDYQPKIDAKTGRLAGVEALLRWQHPRRGLLAPLDFVPVAERFGLIRVLGLWVIDEVCRQLRVWADEGLDMQVSINLSVHQLRQTDLVVRMAEALDRHGVAANRLTFEISESVATADPGATMRMLEQIIQLGALVSIDDYGTGHANLNQLRQLPARQLKIDSSFVHKLEHNADARAVVDAAVRLSHALGLRVVAEGVETVAQQDILLRLGCDELQGFLLGRPMDPAQMGLWAHSSEAVPRP